MPRLHGTWKVERTGGLLPPMLGVRKRFTGDRGVTAIGPLPGFPFVVQRLALRYRRPFSAFVDELEPDGDGFRGRALFRGREYATFRLRRL